eukprot:GHVU01070422.1.p2 GENE.GHVU01070422.1~~GHVU01070422.1.p2  ORF type:complete len:293 (+),score=46.22 GHVU01070422.1:73-879(+)
MRTQSGNHKAFEEYVGSRIVVLYLHLMIGDDQNLLGSVKAALPRGAAGESHALGDVVRHSTAAGAPSAFEGGRGGGDRDGRGGRKRGDGMLSEVVQIASKFAKRIDGTGDGQDSAPTPMEERRMVLLEHKVRLDEERLRSEEDRERRRQHAEDLKAAQEERREKFVLWQEAGRWLDDAMAKEAAAQSEVQRVVYRGKVDQLYELQKTLLNDISACVVPSQGAATGVPPTVTGRGNDFGSASGRGDDFGSASGRGDDFGSASSGNGLPQ